MVYSICDKPSFSAAEDYLEQLTKLKLPSYYTTLLLGNKRDLDHVRYRSVQKVRPKNLDEIICFNFRKVSVNEGHELSLKYSCQFYEVSAAESFAGVSLAFQSLLREAKSIQLLKALPIRRKLGVNSVSKVIVLKLDFASKTG